MYDTYFQIAGFPYTLGCVDGTYVQIRTPAHKIKNTYVNRHDCTSLVLQGICDSNKRFIDVFTGPPGKIHDSRVLSMSFIHNKLRNICENGLFHLIGDSAYPIRDYLLTPYRDYGNLTISQQRYNNKLCSTRVLIENAFGLLKARFRQLIRLDYHDVKKMSKFIISCCVLHNLCIDLQDVFDEEVELNEPPADIPPVDDNDQILKERGEAKRLQICELVNDRNP